MKNLVIDPQKHFPSAKSIFGGVECDYYSPNIPDNMWTGFGKPPIKSELIKIGKNKLEEQFLRNN